MANVPEARASNWGAYISRAPGGLVGEYCIGDVDRTFALYEYLYPYIADNFMMQAYNRERELMPILLQAERFGIKVDIGPMQRDLAMYEQAYETVSTELMGLLGDINYNSGAQLRDALLSKGLADESKFLRTEKGNISVSADSLAGAVEHPQLLALLGYRGALKTCLTTFLRPWEAMASGTGRIHTTWHQTRGETEKGGTRTGRLSSSHPNFTNVPNPFNRELPMGLPDLPMMRQYLLPEDGHVWLKRDYSSQEVRALAHFEDGALMEQYRKNPNLDPHQFAAELITDLTGNSLSRSDTKRIAFSILYGSGIAALAADLGVSNYEAKQFKELYLAAFPGVRDLSSDIKLRGRQNLPVRTIGGRLIYAERGANGRDFSYKLLNHLIQGSAADITKQGLINHYNAGGAQLLALVHDEINVTCPIGRWGVESEKLRMAMADINIDVPLTSDMYVGRNWEDADQNKNVTELAA
jgi:DNA polymerase-1